MRKLKLRRTELFKNKMCALALMVIGGLTTSIDGDATFLVLTLMIGIPLFLAKKNCME